MRKTSGTWSKSIVVGNKLGIDGERSLERYSQIESINGCIVLKVEQGTKRWARVIEY